MKKLTDEITLFTRKAQFKCMEIKNKISYTLSHKSGEGFVDTALKILISVVVGALLLAGLYMLFDKTILPTLTQRVKELFDYKG